jgi:RNA polymerase-binding transcription factor DksA
MAAERCHDTLIGEMADALAGRDISDLHDAEGPSLDVDTVTALALVDAAEDRIWKVDQALERLARGSFGVCEACGDRIPIERLRAIPTTRWCTRCSSTVNAAHAMSNAHG